jgi:hypothetical protein
VLPANLAALDMASPFRCVLAWWAAQHLLAPPQRGPRQIPPYDHVVRVLRLSSQDAEGPGVHRRRRRPAHPRGDT